MCTLGKAKKCQLISRKNQKRGWRIWQLDGNNLLPLLVNKKWSWSSRDCVTGEPRYNANNGFHSFNNKSRMIKSWKDEGYNKPEYVGYVHGEISLWGKTIIHEDGYRSEYAKIRRIFVPRKLLVNRGQTLREFKKEFYEDNPELKHVKVYRL